MVMSTYKSKRNVLNFSTFVTNTLKLALEKGAFIFIFNRVRMHFAVNYNNSVK